MKITVNIDINTHEGKQIFEYLKSFPEVVMFENELLNEAPEEYQAKIANTSASSKDSGLVKDGIKGVKKSKFALAWENPDVKPIILKINDMKAILK